MIQPNLVCPRQLQNELVHHLNDNDYITVYLKDTEDNEYKFLFLPTGEEEE